MILGCPSDASESIIENDQKEESVSPVLDQKLDESVEDQGNSVENFNVQTSI